jgi:hypothetical protein
VLVDWLVAAVLVVEGVSVASLAQALIDGATVIPARRNRQDLTACPNIPPSYIIRVAAPIKAS